MKTFSITSPDKSAVPALQAQIDNLTKPRGALGRLEQLCLQICLIQQTSAPRLIRPYNILFAADHGIERQGVSCSPREVTAQQVLHFVRHPEGSGVGFLCRQHGFVFQVVDAGVDAELPAGCGVIDRKIRRGTSDFLYGDAMTESEFDRCVETGAELVDRAFADGCNVISFGEMGIGNTSSSAMCMHYLTGIPLSDCVGAGSGLDSAGVRHKYEILRQAAENWTAPSNDAVKVMCRFGGFEMAMAVGAMLQAAERRMVILVDGFIMTACMLVASRLYPEVKEYAIFCHKGDESGHARLLASMDADPVLSLGLRLGEGSGAVCAYPIIESAVRMINDMDTFEAENVTKYF